MELQMQIVDRATNLAVAENVIPLCELAKGLEEAGEFEQAADTLRPFWTSLGDRPNTTSLEPQAKAELLLRSGALTGWLGSAKQLTGSQDLAKDLISESATLFSQLGMVEKTAEAHVDLAICYWREGGSRRSSSYFEARARNSRKSRERTAASSTPKYRYHREGCSTRP